MPILSTIALGGIPNKVQVGDMGGGWPDLSRFVRLRATHTAGRQTRPARTLVSHQVKHKDKVGRPDIDSFEAMRMREDREKGFFVLFDYSSDAFQEIESFFKRSHNSSWP